MPRKQAKVTTVGRRQYPDEFRREAEQMLLNGHSASSVTERLGSGTTNALYRMSGLARKWLAKNHMNAARVLGAVACSRLATGSKSGRCSGTLCVGWAKGWVWSSRRVPGPLAGVGRLGVAGKTVWSDPVAVKPPAVLEMEKQLAAV